MVVLQNPENVAVVGRLSVAWLPSDPLLQNADPWIFGYERLAGVPGLYLSSVWYVPCMFRTALRWGQCYTCLYIHVILFIFHASGDYYRGEDLYCTLKKAITFSESMVFELQLKRISLLFQMLNLISTCNFLPFRWDCMCKFVLHFWAFLCFVVVSDKKGYWSCFLWKYLEKMSLTYPSLYYLSVLHRIGSVQIYVHAFKLKSMHLFWWFSSNYPKMLS